MLLDLKILNGDMPLKFDKYVNHYTIKISEDVYSLEIDYKCSENDTIKILNNENLGYGTNYVFIEVTSNNEKNMYTLEVYKKETKNVFNETKIINIEPKEEKLQDYIPVGLIVGGFFIIILTFWLLFHKKKS